jgi:putative membrane protein
MTLLGVLPHVTATLNGLAGLLSVIGVLLIKSGRRRAHHAVMTCAVVVSALFLLAYLLHHFLHPLSQFTGTGVIRPIYFTLLFSHILLAVAVTPMIVLTYRRARKAMAEGGLQDGSFERHKALARWTFPIWLYVSVTGIIVYWLLYHTYAQATS